MTLLELTVVILVLLSLLSALFIGAQAWKNGSDRTLCIMNVQAVQKGLRSFQNLYGYEPGMTVTGLKDQVVGYGKFVEVPPVCPHSGSYIYGGDSIPLVGTLYVNCSLNSSADHKPPSYSDW